MTNLQMEHLVERWEDRRDVKNQMGKFVHYLLLKKEPLIDERLCKKNSTSDNDDSSDLVLFFINIILDDFF